MSVSKQCMHRFTHTHTHTKIQPLPQAASPLLPPAGARRRSLLLPHPPPPAAALAPWSSSTITIPSPTIWSSTWATWAWRWPSSPTTPRRAQKSGRCGRGGCSSRLGQVGMEESERGRESLGEGGATQSPARCARATLVLRPPKWCGGPRRQSLPASSARQLEGWDKSSPRRPPWLRERHFFLQRTPLNLPLPLLPPPRPP